MTPKKYGDLSNPENKFAKMIPYSNFFFDRYSISNQNKNFNRLVTITLYFKKELGKGLLEADSMDILNYFKKLDQKPIKKVTKIKYRGLLSSYYSYVSKFKAKMEGDDSFKNPVPPSEIWDFSGKKESLSIESIELEENVLTMEVVDKIFEYLYYVVESKRIFIAMSLILYSGARVSEVCHIELKNLDIKNRWFITRVKSKKSDKKDGIYFFPVFFTPELRGYITLLKEEYSNPKYLFQEGDSFLHPATLRKHMRRAKKALGLKVNCNPHAFRDFINTMRIEMRITKEIRKILLNQKSKDVNISHYAKKFKNRKYLRDLYDKCNPFKELIKPIPKI